MESNKGYKDKRSETRDIFAVFKTLSSLFLRFIASERTDQIFLPLRPYRCSLIMLLERRRYLFLFDSMQPEQHEQTALPLCVSPRVRVSRMSGPDFSLEL